MATKTTKVTAAQRKHGITSLQALYHTKTQKIVGDFSSNPENQLRMVPQQKLPSNEDILKALVGLESPATLKITKEEFVRQNTLRHMGGISIYPHQLANALNQAEINAVMEYNDNVNQRRRQEVDGRAALIAEAYRRACDIVNLADSGDDVLRTIQEFEAREF